MTVQAQTTISDIVDNPGRYNDEVVTIEGEVIRHVDTGSTDEGTSRTQNYILENDGSEIRTKTTNEPPETGTRYQVEGLVSISPFNRQPVIVEQNRTELSSQADQANSSDQLRQGFSTTTVYLIFGLGILVVVVLAYFAYASGQDEKFMSTSPTNGKPPNEPVESTDSISSLSSTEIEPDGEGAESQVSPATEHRIKSESSSSPESAGETGGGPETLKFKAPPKTMKFIPGRLVVAAGPDQGKEFRIAGRPTPDGNVVTIGRAKVEGERAFSHIQLGNTYRTVSRLQAEIIQQDQTILLKNKSETNPTMVNGDHVPSEETVELSDGDMIRMGELMIRYERD